MVKDFLGVIKRSQGWIGTNKIAAESIVAEELNLPLPVVQKAWPKHNFHPKLGAKEIQDIQAKADFLYQHKFVKHQINVKKDLLEL